MNAARTVLTNPNDLAVCHKIVKRSGSNLTPAKKLIQDPDRRDAFEIAYAFARFTDDLVDEPEYHVNASERLHDWATAALSHDLPMPTSALLDDDMRAVLRAFRMIREIYGVPADAVQRLLAGCRQDLTKTRYATWEETINYCRMVAGGPGLICLKVFGTPLEPMQCSYSEALAVAMQLTNILRDVVEDYRRFNRVYLPEEEMIRCGVASASGDGAFARLLMGEQKYDAYTHHAIHCLLQEVAIRARVKFDEAEQLFQGLGRCNKNVLRPARLMQFAYSRLRREIMRRQCDVFGRPIKLSKCQKIRMYFKAKWE